MTTPLPLTHIEIDGFRGLRRLALGPLSRVNVLVGGNNSGKTSVLEAISILAKPTQPAAWIDMIRWRDPGGMDESRLHSLRWCFSRTAESFAEPDELKDGSCRFKVAGGFALQQLKVSFQEISGEPSPDELKYAYRLRPQMEEKFLTQEWRGGEITHEVLTSQLSLFPDQFVEFSAFRFWEELPIRKQRLNASKDARTTLELPCEVLAAYSYQGNIRQTSALSAAIDLTDEPSLVSLLQQFDPDVQAVDIRSTMGLRPAIYLKHARLGLAPLSIFGDAMRRAVLLASTLSSLPAGGVLLMDEAEAGIHVGAKQRFFAWILQVAKQRQVQVFMPTHSLEALDALLMAMPGEAADNDVVVFQLHRNQVQEPVSDQVQVKRFAGNLLHRLRFDRGLDVR